MYRSGEKVLPKIKVYSIEIISTVMWGYNVFIDQLNHSIYVSKTLLWSYVIMWPENNDFID